MNVALKRTMLAVAVGLFCTSASVYAQDGNSEFSQSYWLDQGSEHYQSIEFNKYLSLYKDIYLTGTPTVTGNIDIDSAAISIIDNRQKNHNNYGDNYWLENDASIGDDVGSNASGNLGFNVAAGDNNQQDNAAALAATDASFVFGMADSEVFVNQLGHSNETVNTGSPNTASISGNAFNAASGNIGVNVTAGNNNQQKNALAASVATSNLAEASVDSSQYSAGNETFNEGSLDYVFTEASVELSGFSIGGYSGQYSGRGNAYQANNYYPDTWTGKTHTGGSQIGHDDFDGEAQGAVKNPYRGDDDMGQPIGGFAFDTDSSGTEMGDIGLESVLSGSVFALTPVVVMAMNDASLSGAAFQNASGNIGVNVSAGTGNQQANSLAMAVAQPAANGGGGGGGGEQ